MRTVTIWFGIALILLGLIGFFATGGVSPTALIPAGFGIVFLLLAALARNPQRRAWAMHIAVVAALIGLLGALPGLARLVTLISGGEVLRPAAAVAQSVMAVLMGIYVGLGIRSFVVARRQRA